MARLGNPQSEMPFGAVMASGGAAQAAIMVQWFGLALSLLVIAIAQALLVLVGAVESCDGMQRPGWRHGLFTVPLGLAVITATLQTLAMDLAIAGLWLAWLAIVTLGYWYLMRAIAGANSNSRVDGTWFLAPAALLGVAGATATAMPGGSCVHMLLPIAMCLCGVLGYAWIIMESARRLSRHGLRGTPLAPWWIAAGCGGLAAAMLGQVMTTASCDSWSGLLAALMLTTWSAGTILLVLVLLKCAHHACTRTGGVWAVTWPPVFSTAVYAAGTASLSRLAPLGWLHSLALAASCATLILWLVNSLLWAFWQLHIERKR